MGAGAFRLPRRGRARLRVIGTVAVLAVATVVVFMGVAFAHHPVLSGETVCTNGDHEITWTIGNSESDKVMTITGATATMGAQTYAVTDYSLTVDPSGSTLATTIVPGSTTGVVTLTVNAWWKINGVKATRTTTVSLLSTCTGESTTAPTTAPPTTAPPTTEAPTTVPESTVPETTVPEWTVPQSTVPESTVPETTVPEWTVPQSTVPESTTIMTLGSTATLPTTTIPEGTTAPDATTSTVAAAGSTVTTAHSTDTTGRIVQSGAQQQKNQLPFTGSDSWPPVIGLAALALGGGLLVVSRRRNLRRS
jgi:LPXTG-motif cell wall-anchored protein